MKIIQISDTHMVPPGYSLYGLDPYRRLEACLADVMARHGDAAHCVLTGDLADLGEPEAYQQLRALLQSFSLPWSLLIGNHDNRDNFVAAFPELPRDPAGFVQHRLETASGHLLFLDSHEPKSGIGVYCETRAAWLERQLDEIGNAPVYLFIHHPPFLINLPRMDRITLADPGHLAQVLEGRSNVRHLFFGHVHRPLSGSWRGIAVSAPRSTVHQVEPDYDDPAMAYNLESPSYSVIFIEEDRVLVHMEDYLACPSVPEDLPRRAPLPSS